MHGMFGNIWLHAVCMKEEATFKVAETPLPMMRSATRGFERAQTRSTLCGDVTPQPELKKNVIYQINKSLCKVPPELLDQGLQKMIDMPPLPYILHLREVYEDLENIYLVYDPLGANAMCLLDKVNDDMHHNEDDLDGSIWNEANVVILVRNLMSMFQQAHPRGLVHGCLRLGNCYLNKKDNIDSLKILEFGLLQLFSTAQAVPPSTVLQPLDEFKSPLPPYVRDFRSMAEMMYTTLAGIPFCALESSREERRVRYYRGAASFADKAFSKISEPAKHFITELVTPPHLRLAMAEQHLAMLQAQTAQQAVLEAKQPKQPLHLEKLLPEAPKVKKEVQLNDVLLPQHLEAERFLSHPFLEEIDEACDREEASDIIVMRYYGRWRNALKWQLELVKLLADRMRYKHIRSVREDLTRQKGPDGKVEWTVFEAAINKVCTAPADTLKRYSRAFGENNGRSIHVDDFTAVMEAWRKKRVRELLWEAFAKLRAGGLINDQTDKVHVCHRDDLLDALMLRVTNSWAGPSSAVEILFPPDPMSEEESLNAEIEQFLGREPHCNFLDLAAKGANI